jgi:hypothetical protein
MVDETMPMHWLIHDVKVTPASAIRTANDWQDVNEDDAAFIIQHCRIDSNDALVSVTEGMGGTVSAIQGTYTLFIDAVNSYPLDTLPQVNDIVEWSDGYSSFKTAVKSISSMYSDSEINHWEVALV